MIDNETQSHPRNKLTLKQRAFVSHLVAGMEYTDAYVAAGYVRPSSHQVLRVKACQLKASPVVAEALRAEQKVNAEVSLVTRADLVRGLLRIIDREGADAEATSRDVIAAIAQASRMLGFDKPTEVRVSVEGSLLDRIRAARPVIELAAAEGARQALESSAVAGEAVELDESEGEA
jgi:phage terminase small subunit